MSKVRLYGATSGYVDLAAPAVADDATLTLPTAAAGFVPGNGGIGTNVVQALKTDVFTTTSTSYVDITDLTLTITPTANTSKVLIIAHAIVTNANQNDSVFIQLVRNSTAIFIGDAAGSRVRASSGLYLGNSLTPGSTYAAPISHIDSPATTSATTYKLQMRSALGNAAILGRQDNDTDNAQRGRFPASLIAIEVAA